MVVSDADKNEFYANRKSFSVSQLATLNFVHCATLWSKHLLAQFLHCENCTQEKLADVVSQMRKVNETQR